MKSALFALTALLAAPALLRAQGQPSAPNPAPAPPASPVYPVPAVPAPATPVYIYDQKPVSGRSYLVNPEQAQSIINRFKDEYKKLGNPRLVIYINRDLIDENSGVKLSSHKRVVESTRTVGGNGALTSNPQQGAAEAAQEIERVASTNIFRARDPKEVSLTDRQTMRDVERLFGRPFRMAGAHLADQRVATQLIGSKPLDNFIVQPESEQARKERAALTNVADVVLEILITSKDVPVTELSGDQVYSAPDIQATAIRLSDARILGQATAADLIGQGPAAGRAVRTFGVREIAEATALSLMEDMMLQ